MTDLFSEADYINLARSDFDVLRVLMTEAIAKRFHDVVAPDHFGDIIGTAATRYAVAIASIAHLTRLDDVDAARDAVNVLLDSLVESDPILFEPEPEKALLIAMRLADAGDNQPSSDRVAYHTSEVWRADPMERRRQYYRLRHKLTPSQFNAAVAKSDRYDGKPTYGGPPKIVRGTR